MCRCPRRQSRPDRPPKRHESVPAAGRQTGARPCRGLAPLAVSGPGLVGGWHLCFGHDLAVGQPPLQVHVPGAAGGLQLEAAHQVAAEHQAELEAQKQAAAVELTEVRQKTQAEIAATMRSRLLELASRKRK